MRKLRMNVEELRVDSFATVAPSRARGTVAGMESWTEQDQERPTTNYSLFSDCSCPGPICR